MTINKSNMIVPVDKSKMKSILLEAGKIIDYWFRLSPEVETKMDGSPLTIADKEVDSFLKKALHDLFPKAGWLSEETVDSRERLEKEWVWIVDPLDGTKEFTMQLPEVSVSIGLVFKGNVVLGAVYNPITGEGGIGSIDGKREFWGFDEPQPSAKTLEEVTAIVSRSEFTRGQIDPFKLFFADVIPVGSVAYKLLRVSAGRNALTFSVQPKSEWDICGGAGLLQASGMQFRRVDDKDVIFNQPDVLIPCHTAGGSQNLVDGILKHLKGVAHR